MSPTAKPQPDAQPTEPTATSTEVPVEDSVALANKLAAEIAAAQAPVPDRGEHAGQVFLVNDTVLPQGGWTDAKVAAVMLGDRDAVGWRIADPDKPAVAADATNPDGGDAGDSKE